MAEQTKYVVQRRHDGADGADEPRRELWEDVGSFDARSSAEAIELAVGQGQKARAGLYRTSAARYLSEPVPAEVTTEIVVTVGGKASLPEPQEAEAPAGA